MQPFTSHVVSKHPLVPAKVGISLEASSLAVCFPCFGYLNHAISFPTHLRDLFYARGQSPALSATGGSSLCFATCTCHALRLPHIIHYHKSLSWDNLKSKVMRLPAAGGTCIMCIRVFALEVVEATCSTWTKCHRYGTTSACGQCLYVSMMVGVNQELQKVAHVVVARCCVSQQAVSGCGDVWRGDLNVSSFQSFSPLLLYQGKPMSSDPTWCDSWSGSLFFALS